MANENTPSEFALQIRTNFPSPPDPEPLISRNEVDVMVRMAGNLDPRIRNQVLAELTIKQDKTVPLRKGEVEKVDYLSMLDAYSKEESMLLLDKSVAIELTKGCNNFCPFCLYRKKGDPVEKGIVAKARMDTMPEFLKKYGYFLSDNADPYHSNDPLDGDITDFIRMYHETVHHQREYTRPFVVTTAVAPGREQELVNLLLYLARDDVYKKDNKFKRDTRVVLSINEANEGRINYALVETAQRLKGQGMSEDEIHQFLGKQVTKSRKYLKDVVKQGMMIGERDIFEVETVSCRQGVLISADGVKGVVPVAATPYNPAGEVRFAIPPGKAIELTPKVIMPPQGNPFLTEELVYNFYLFNLALPTVENTERKELNLPDQASNVLMHMGREVLSLTRSFTAARSLRLRDKAAYTPEQVRSLRKRAVDGLVMRCKVIESLQPQLAQLAESGEGGRSKEEFEFYQTLGKVFTLRAKIMSGVIERSDDIYIWSQVARKLDAIGGTEDDVKLIAEIGEMTK